MNTPKIHNIQIRDVEFGKNVTVISPVNIYECFIDEDSFIGPFVEIQSLNWRYLFVQEHFQKENL